MLVVVLVVVVDSLGFSPDLFDDEDDDDNDDDCGTTLLPQLGTIPVQLQRFAAGSRVGYNVAGNGQPAGKWPLAGGEGDSARRGSGSQRRGATWRLVW